MPCFIIRAVIGGNVEVGKLPKYNFDHSFMCITVRSNMIYFYLIERSFSRVKLFCERVRLRSTTIVPISTTKR